MKHVLAINDINPIIRKAGIQVPPIDVMPFRIILDYEFIYCESGHFIIEYQDKSLTISPGQIAIIPPDTLHRFLVPNQHIESYWVHFDFVQYPYQQKISAIVHAKPTLNTMTDMHLYSIPRPMIEIMPHYKLPSFFYVDQSLEPIKLFQLLNDFHNRKPYGWQLQCKQILLKLILDMLAKLERSEPLSSQQDDFILSIEQYIQSNIYRHLTVGELAQHFHYHPDTLTRLFKSKRNETLKTYIRQCKVNSSKALLTNTNYPIDTIAEIYGFTDRTYYSKVFKKVVGVSPTTFRNRNPDNP